MGEFRFEPSLFTYRAEVMEALAEAGFTWLESFSAVDLRHSEYGLEVCGIPQQAEARKIQAVLRRKLPSWRFPHIVFNDLERDRGWKVVIQREPDRGTTNVYEV
jgi:hypothetical protein